MVSPAPALTAGAGTFQLYCRSCQRAGAASVITSLVVLVLAVVDSSQEVVDDKGGHRPAESFTRILIGAEMLTREDSARAGLVLGVRETVEGAGDISYDFRSDDQVKWLGAEDGVQQQLSACADRGMGAWIRRISSGLGGLRKPIWIHQGVGVAVRIGGANRRHRPPKVIGVLGVVKCDHFVRQGDVEQCEHTSALCSRQVMRLYRRLSDFVPVVLNRSAPELADELLICRGGRAAQHAQRLHFIEGGGVFGAGQCRRRPETKLVRAL